MSKTTNAVILSGGMCKWGVREASYLDMVQEAGKACMDDLAGLTPKHIDGLLFASTFVGRRSCQVNTAPVVAERLGLKPTSICARVDVLCAGISEKTVFCGEYVLTIAPQLKEKLGDKAIFSPEELWRPKAGLIALEGYRKLQKNRKGDDLFKLKPVYIREPDIHQSN